MTIMEFIEISFGLVIKLFEFSFLIFQVCWNMFMLYLMMEMFLFMISGGIVFLILIVMFPGLITGGVMFWRSVFINMEARKHG